MSSPGSTAPSSSTSSRRDCFWARSPRSTASRSTKEDVEKRVGQIAEAQGRKPDELINDLAGTDALSQIEDDLWLEKVHEFLVSVSNVKTEALLPDAEAEGSSGAGRERGRVAAPRRRNH